MWRRLSIIFASNFHNVLCSIICTDTSPYRVELRSRLPFCERECVQLCLLSNKSFTEIFALSVCVCVGVGVSCNFPWKIKLLALTRVLINLLPRKAYSGSQVTVENHKKPIEKFYGLLPSFYGSFCCRSAGAK